MKSSDLRQGSPWRGGTSAEPHKSLLVAQTLLAVPALLWPLRDFFPALESQCACGVPAISLWANHADSLQSIEVERSFVYVSIGLRYFYLHVARAKLVRLEV